MHKIGGAGACILQVAAGNFGMKARHRLDGAGEQGGLLWALQYRGKAVGRTMTVERTCGTLGGEARLR